MSRSVAALGPELGVDVVLVGRPELDLADTASIYPSLASLNPDIIVSAAAYTAVDKAESDREHALAINGPGAGAVAEAAAQLGVPVIHLSSDYVFDGSLYRAYAETDATAPISAYGLSKLQGEILVAAATPDHVIFRTAWVYSVFGNNFVKTMLRLGETREALSVVADQWGCPTSAEDIGRTIITAAKVLVGNADPRYRGIFHLTGSGEATWADFASHIFASAEAFGRKPVAVNRITTADYPTPARRPANSRLSGEKLAAVYAIRLPDWKISTDTVVGSLLGKHERRT